MRILLWHGYLLGGTGSNVYTRQLARAWMRAGHDVTVFSQDPRPDVHDLGGARVVRPDVEGLLPVFVLDRYEGYEVKLVQDCRADELDRWVDQNAKALVEHLPADVVFCNHVLLGGPVGVASGARFAVKAHGSELEYSMRDNPELAAWGRDCLRRAAATFVGSAHIRRVLEEVCGPQDRVHEVPPGVEIDDWKPAERVDGARRPPGRGTARPTEPGQRRGTTSRRRERRAPRPVPRRRPADGRLLREAHAQQGRARAPRGARGGRRAHGHRRLRGSASGAGTGRRQGRPVHGPARAPPSRPPARPGRHVRRPVDLPRGVRDGRRRSCCGRMPAARRAPLRARGDRRRACGGVPAAAAPPRRLHLGRRGRSPGEAHRAPRPRVHTTGRRFVRRRGGPRWTGGAGPASRAGCWSRSQADTSPPAVARIDRAPGGPRHARTTRLRW